MMLSALGAALVVLGTVTGAATGAAYGYGQESPHVQPIHVLPSKCPPVTEFLDITTTEVVYVQETVTATSINYWPADLQVTEVVFETTTSYLPELVTVTPLPVHEPFYVTVTTPVLRGVEEYYVNTVVETTSTWRTVSHLQYVTPRVATEYVPLTKTLTTTISSSFSSTYTHHTSLLVTEYSTVTTTTQVYATTTVLSNTFTTHFLTQFVSSPVYETTTSVVAITTVPVFATASCVPAEPVRQPQYKGKASGESVHEKMLRVKEYLRNKFAGAYDQGLRAFDVHIDKLRKKLDQSKTLSTSRISTSYADEPALRKFKTHSLLDNSRSSPYGANKGASLLGTGKAFTAKGTAGLGGSRGESTDLDGDLGDLKSFAGALLQGFKTSAVEQLGRGKGGSPLSKAG